MKWKRPTDEGEAMVLALKVPFRRQLLVAFTEGERSPKDLEVKFGERLSYVSYHTRALAFYGVIDLVDKRPVRGATQHFYRANNLGRRALELAVQTGMLDKEEVSDDGDDQNVD